MDDEHREHDGPDLPAPLEHAAELFVYAPLGFLLGARHQFPHYVARGRREVGQVHGWLTRRARAAAHESTAALRGLGLTSAPASSDGPDPATFDPPTLSVVPSADPAASEASVGSNPPPGPIDDPDLDADVLAIPGYESLSASQVVPRLVSLTPDELEEIRQYESAARGRKTILSRIAQLQAG